MPGAIGAKGPDFQLHRAVSGTHALHPLQDRLGDSVLRRKRHMVLAVTLEDRHLVVARIEADLGARYVVEDDRVDGLALELGPGPVDRVGTGFGGEPDDRLLGAATRGHGREDVLGGFQP